MAEKHIANREVLWVALNVSPDFCQVGNTIVPFDIARTLNQDKVLYARSVFARGQPVMMLDSVARGVMGNAGRGVDSLVSQNQGHVWVRSGSTTVYAEGRPLARHLDQCLMNAELDGVPLDSDIAAADP